MSAPGLGATPTPQLLQARGVHATGLNSIFLGVLCKILENYLIILTNMAGKKNWQKEIWRGKRNMGIKSDELG